MTRPRVIANCALTRDGIAASASVSCPADWARVHALREAADAVAVGRRTFEIDHPRLNVRESVLGRTPHRQPTPVIFAGHSQVVLDEDVNGRTRIVVGERPPSGPHALHVPAARNDLHGALRALAALGVGVLLVEGGLVLLRAFLAAGCVDETFVYVATVDPTDVRRALERAFGIEARVLAGRSPSRLGEGMLVGARSPATSDRLSEARSTARLSV